MFSYEIKIPKNRVAVLIGKKGFVKRNIQRLTNTRLIIDSKEGDVTIESEDSFAAYNTQNIIKAIGRGFNPNIALMLINENYSLEVLDITEFTGKSDKNIKRIKARIIGTKGKAWKMIERLTGCYLSVYGKTVSIIGLVENVVLARQAVEDLLKGAPHGNAYKYVQDKKRRMRQGL
ncbi:MAG: KH domain-containing protein [Nanoarchaeota archaeon]|nr:KH domain-containing protein [Nanoarchaeota archaeon]